MSTADTAVVVPESRKEESLAELHQNAAVSDSLTLAQQQSIERSIKESQAIGDVEDVSVLVPEYRDNPMKGFLLGIEDLKKRYSGIRRVRGDGDCFYRAYLYSFMTALVKAVAAGGDAAARANLEWNDLVKRVKDSKDWLVGVGYNETAIESFYDVFVEELEATSSRTVSEVHGLFNEEQGVMSYCVWYLRLLTAGFLKLNRDEFAPFLDDGMGDVDGFCAREVEPVGKECEQIHIIALTRALHVGVRIEYLDGRSFADHIDQMIFPEGSDPKITLLYRRCQTFMLLNKLVLDDSEPRRSPATIDVSSSPQDMISLSCVKGPWALTVQPQDDDGAGGRGRGRGMTLPAWMTQGTGRGDGQMMNGGLANATMPPGGASAVGGLQHPKPPAMMQPSQPPLHAGMGMGAPYGSFGGGGLSFEPQPQTAGRGALPPFVPGNAGSGGSGGWGAQQAAKGPGSSRWSNAPGAAPVPSPSSYDTTAPSSAPYPPRSQQQQQPPGLQQQQLQSSPQRQPASQGRFSSTPSQQQQAPAQSPYGSTASPSSAYGAYPQQPPLQHQQQQPSSHAQAPQPHPQQQGQAQSPYGAAPSPSGAYKQQSSLQPKEPQQPSTHQQGLAQAPYGASPSSSSGHGSYQQQGPPAQPQPSKQDAVDHQLVQQVQQAIQRQQQQQHHQLPASQYGSQPHHHPQQPQQPHQQSMMPQQQQHHHHQTAPQYGSQYGSQNSLMPNGTATGPPQDNYYGVAYGGANQQVSAPQAYDQGFYQSYAQYASYYGGGAYPQPETGGVQQQQQPVASTPIGVTTPHVQAQPHLASASPLSSAAAPAAHVATAHAPAPVAAPAPASAPQDDLPEGWQAVYDSNTGYYYYWHATTGQTTWEKPSVAPLPPPPPGPTAHAQNNYVIAKAPEMYERPRGLEQAAAADAGAEANDGTEQLRKRSMAARDVGDGDDGESVRGKWKQFQQAHRHKHR